MLPIFTKSLPKLFNIFTCMGARKKEEFGTQGITTSWFWRFADRASQYNPSN